MAALCIDCGCIRARFESNPCLDCALVNSKKAEAAGHGDETCRDCGALFAAVEYDEDDNAIVNVTCPGCDSDDIEPLSKALERAAVKMDGAL